MRTDAEQMDCGVLVQRRMFCVYVLVVRQLDTTRTVRVPSPRGRIGIRNYWLRSQSALKRVGKLAYRMQTWYIWPGPVERSGGAVARRHGAQILSIFTHLV